MNVSGKVMSFNKKQSSEKKYRTTLVYIKPWKHKSHIDLLKSVYQNHFRTD